MAMISTSLTRLCLKLPKKTCFSRWKHGKSTFTKQVPRRPGYEISSRASASLTKAQVETTYGSLDSTLRHDKPSSPLNLFPHTKVPQILPGRSIPVLCKANECSLVIQDASGRMDVPLIWLRDNCSCDKCFNKGSYQRNSWTLATEVGVKKASVSNGYIHTIWEDGHESHHELAATKGYFQSKDMDLQQILIAKHLWDKETWKNFEPRTVPRHEVFTEPGLKQLLTNIQRFGFGLVNGCGQTEAATEALIKRIGPPMPTTFSPGMWTFTSNMERGDTAYSNCYLAPHTDTTYFSNPARIQVFHCLERDGCVGGENILVDGFACAEKLQTLDPVGYNTLASVPQECVYREPGVCYKWTDTIFRPTLGSRGLKQVRFNMYDRSERPPHCPVEKLNGFYKSLKQYAEVTQSEENQYHLQLVPGLVIFIDNWRVLHGRTSFSGKRVLTGCYMSNDEYEHACRKFSLI